MGLDQELAQLEQNTDIADRVNILDEIVQVGKREIRVHNSSRFQPMQLINVYSSDLCHKIATIEIEEEDVLHRNVLRIRGGVPEVCRAGMLLVIPGVH